MCVRVRAYVRVREYACVCFCMCVQVADRLGSDAVYFESDERRPTTAVDLQV